MSYRVTKALLAYCIAETAQVSEEELLGRVAAFRKLRGIVRTATVTPRINFGCCSLVLKWETVGAGVHAN